MAKLRPVVIIIFLLWVAFVLGAFYVTQRPFAIQVGKGLCSTAWSLILTGILLTNAASWGGHLIRKIFPFINAEERALLGTGLGLGFFGLIGFGLAVLGAAHWYILLILQVGLLAVVGWLGWLREAREDFTRLWQTFRTPVARGFLWIPCLAALLAILCLMLAFAPPADSFDALAYHLAVPSLWLKLGGLTSAQILPSYWFPELAEGVFVWGLGLGSEITPQLLHFTWGILTIALLWFWIHKLWGNSLAWRSIALMISMPSLPMIASWAYTDLTLCFFVVAVLYLLWRSIGVTDWHLWVLSGCFCGMAMGVKYASFVLPLVAIIWIPWRQKRRLVDMIRSGCIFGAIAILVACPWYIRNWIWTNNPFFPFVFGGKFWDSFQAAHYSFGGTGIGLNLVEIFLLPFNVTLGHRDTTYFDGRIGPLWLILLPVCLWVLWSLRREIDEKRLAIYLLALFGALSLGFWTIGVITTNALWQSRYLFPALFMLSPLAALAWENLSHLDWKRVRISNVFNVLAAISILVSLLDFGLFVLFRNPLAVAIGIEAKQAYFERIQPTYGDALALVNQTPKDARIYFLFEPRTYGMSRSVQSDLILDNLGHDFYIYHTPEAILHAWRFQGYTYVLYQREGDTLLENPIESRRLFSLLEIVSATPNTILYRVPPP